MDYFATRVNSIVKENQTSILAAGKTTFTSAATNRSNKGNSHAQFIQIHWRQRGFDCHRYL